MKKFFLIMTIIVFGSLINAQDVQLVIPKGSIENSIKTLLDARAASFSSYTGGYGVDMYNVKLIYSDSHPLTVTLTPPNTFRLSCGIVGRANVDYFLDEFEISIEGNITIEGTLTAQGTQGLLTLIGSGEAVINYSGIDGFLLSLILADELNFPDFELASFVFTLPTVPSNYFTTNYPTVSIIDDNVILGLQTPSNFLIVDQKDQNGNRIIGSSIGHWENNTFVNYIVPVIFSNLPFNTWQTFRGYQDYLLSPFQKYNNWNNLSSTENHKTIFLTGELSRLNSNFKQTNVGITIKNNLEATGINGGNIQFKDPWLIDYPDGLFSNTLRNQGMSAPFKDRTSPFLPDYTSNFNGDVYKGIFLNQSGPDNNWQSSYYSVGSLSEQTISVNNQNRKFYPFKWGGTGVTLQGEYNPETGIVFTSSDAVATATLKGQLMSNSTTGISSNSQRKMVRTDNGIYHVMYESMGNVFYTHSLTSNFDGEWAADQFILDNAKNPAIEYDGNIVKAVCEYYDPAYSTNVDLYLLTFTQGQDGKYYNSDDEVFTTCPSSYFGSAKPVISYNPAGVALVYRKNSTEGLKVKTKWLLNGTWSWQAESTIPQTDANSINPSIIGETGIIHIAYESQSTIKYKLAYNQGQNWLYNNVITLSTGSGYTTNTYPSISLCGYSSPYVMVSWRGTYTSAVEKRIAKENDESDHIETAVAKVGYGTSWGGFSSFSNHVYFTNNNSLNTALGSICNASREKLQMLKNNMYKKVIII